MDSQTTENPFQTQKVSEYGIPRERPRVITGAEIRRWPFAWLLLCTGAATWAVMYSVSTSPIVIGLKDGVFTLVFFWGFGVALWLTFARSNSIGIGGSWGLFVAIPFINFFFLATWLALPEDFAEHRKLDRPGAAVLCGCLFTLVFAIAATVDFWFIG